MWILWLIGIVVIIYWLSSLNKGSHTISNAAKPSPAASETRMGYKQMKDGGFVIGPGLPFPMTLYGLDAADADKLVTAFKQGEGYEISEWFSHLVAQKNIQCKELNEWIGEARLKIHDVVKKRVLASTEWTQASELDKKDLLAEIQESAVEELSIRPGDAEATRTLLLEEPHDMTADDALLERFKDNPQIYQTLLYAISAGTKVQIAPAGDYRRKAFDELYEKGFMRRGREIPVDDILAIMTIKQMQEIAGADAPKKFTRKAYAIDFLKGLPDIWQRLEKAISFRELFQAKPIDGIDIGELAKSHAYSSQVARVVLTTVRTSWDSQQQKESQMDEHVEGWELYSEDCCSSCRALHGKTWKRLPQKLPPFHVGCKARIYPL